MYIYIYIYVHIYIYIYVSEHIYIYIYMCVCTYAYSIHSHFMRASLMEVLRLVGWGNVGEGGSLGPHNWGMPSTTHIHILSLCALHLCPWGDLKLDELPWVAAMCAEVRLDSTANHHTQMSSRALVCHKSSDWCIHVHIWCDKAGRYPATCEG